MTFLGRVLSRQNRIPNEAIRSTPSGTPTPTPTFDGLVDEALHVPVACDGEEVEATEPDEEDAVAVAERVPALEAELVAAAAFANKTICPRSP